jgi:hypothetical protein
LSSLKKQLNRELEINLVPLLPYGMSIKEYKSEGKGGKRIYKMSKADAVVNVHFKDINQSEVDYDYAYIQIIDFEGPALSYINDTNKSSDSFIVPVTQKSSSLDTSLEKIDRIYGYQKTSQKIAHMVGKVLGAREKKFYQLAAMYDELGEEKNEIKYLALGSFYCRQARMNNQDCNQLRTLSLSVTE